MREWRASIASVAIFLCASSGSAVSDEARSPSSTATEVPAACADSVDEQIRALVRHDSQGILAKQLRLTTLKLARESVKSGQNTVETYLKRELGQLEKEDGGGVRESLRRLYEKHQAPLDAAKLAEKLKSGNYFKRSLRFKNEDVAAYVFAHRELKSGSPYGAMDSAILWYQSKVAEKATARPGSAAANLLQISTLVGQYTGMMKDMPRVSVEDLDRRVAYLDEGIEAAYAAFAKQVIAKVDPECLKAWNCPECTLSKQFLESKLAGFLGDLQPVGKSVATAEAQKEIAAKKDRVDLVCMPGPEFPPESILHDRFEPSSEESSEESLGDLLERRLENVGGTPAAKPSGAVSAIEATPAPPVRSGETAPPMRAKTTEEIHAEADRIWVQVSKSVDLSAPLKREVFRKAYLGLQRMKHEDPNVKDDRLMVVDFDLPATKKRLYIVDLVQGSLILQAHTTHGVKSDPRGTGMATNFSNRNGSNQSSLGFFKTGETYNGTYGKSLRIDGKDENLNSNVRDRGVVIHGLKDMSSKSPFAYSLGCLAVPQKESVRAYGVRDSRTVKDFVIDQMMGGRVVFVNSSVVDLAMASKYLKGSA